MSRIEKIVAEYRIKNIEGKIVTLAPVGDTDLPNIVRMRNDPKMMHSFNQPEKITLNTQKKWYDEYLQRSNDLYWVIKDKHGLVVGTNRLYDIGTDKCEQGSLMIDSEYSRTAPFAVEAIKLTLDFAFNILGVQTIVNKDRYDNKNMNSLSKRFGFKFLKEIDIRGVTYNYYELRKDNYKCDEINEVLQLWINR